MRKYQIKDLERLSGIKAHTIRMWEQRYQLLTPERTDTNIRYYKDDDVRKILNVSLLLQKGYKISNVCSLNEVEINERVQEALEANISIDQNLETYLTGMTIAMIEMDEEKFNNIYSRSVHEVGFQQTVTGLIYPFLLKIGVMWGINEINPAQEHFVSNLIRQKMISAINDLPLNRSKKEEFILYLPQNELHEIGLIMAHYILKSRGYKVIYLGQDVPHDDLLSVIDSAKPTHVMTIITAMRSNADLQRILDSTQSEMGGAQFVVSGLQHYAENLNIPKNVTMLSSAQDFIDYLTD